MKHSLTEIVDVIKQRLQEHPEVAPSEKGIRSWLVRQGYNKREIDAAIKLMHPGFPSRPVHRRPTPTSVRMFSDYESYKMSPEARNAFTRLELYGLLSEDERESILEYLDHFEGEVGMSELDYLLSWMVCSGRDVSFQQTLYNVFEGKEKTFH